MDAEATEPEAALETGQATDVGRQRRHNEDSLLFLDDARLYAVADGMGGHQGGAVASRLAVETLASAFENRSSRELSNPDKLPPQAFDLVDAIGAANDAIRTKAMRTVNLAEMGTTLITAWLPHRTRRLFLGHVGDSRCYRLRGGVLEQLTRDHTVTTLSKTGRFVHRLSRAVGPCRLVEVDVAVLTPQLGDVFLLCSDGLNKMLPHSEIQGVLQSPVSAAAHASELVAKANQAGGVDNVTAIVLHVKPEATG